MLLKNTIFAPLLIYKRLKYMIKSIKVIGLMLTLSLVGLSNVLACTSFLITKGASKDGSTMITYAADSHALYGELYYTAAGKHAAGTMIDIYEWDTGKKLGQIPQVAETFSVVGNMNQYQLAISETTYTGREELRDTTGLIDYGSLIQITLQRAKTAREAIKVMHELTSTYGYYSTGESFSISDPNEVWIMELIGKGKKILDKKGNVDSKKNSKGMVWVAYMIPDGYISGHANQARITTIKPADGKTSISSKDLAKKYNLASVECMYSADVVSYAKAIGIYDGNFEDFSFCETYAPLNYMALRGCEARVWAMYMRANPAEAIKYESYARGEDQYNRMPLWFKADRKLGVEDVMGFMRDYYQGTSLDMSQDFGAGPFSVPYRWRPMTMKVDGKEYMHERATATQQTAFSFVTQSRSWLPDEIGGIFWFGVDDTYLTCYAPIYCAITEIPLAFKVGNGNMVTYSPTSAFWLFNQVSNFTYHMFDRTIGDVQKVQRELENGFISKVAMNDKRMANEKDPAKLVAFANNFSNAQTAIMFDAWKQLSEYLLVKFIDGNIKKTDEHGNFKTSPYGKERCVSPNQPPYPEWYQRKIVEDAGENLRVKELK